MHTRHYSYVPFLTFLLVFAGSVSAQSWETRLQKAYSLRQAGNYPEAVQMARQVVNIAIDIFGKDHPNYARSLGLLGSLQLDKGEYVSADTNLINSRQLFEKLNIQDTNYVATLQSMGILRRLQGNFSSAETILSDAQQRTALLRGQNSDEYIDISRSLGNVYAARQEYKKAKSLMLKLLTLQEQRTGRQGFAYANTLNTLGLIYLNLEDYVQAESYFIEGLRAFEQVLGTDHATIGSIRGNIGFMYLNQGAYETALQQLNKANAIQTRKDPGSLNHITVLSNIALCHLLTKQYTKADSLYQLALKMVNDKFGPTHPQYGIFLKNIGTVAEAMENYSLAEEMYRKALIIYDKSMSRETTGAAQMLGNLANLKATMGSRTQADSLYRQALKIISNEVGPNSLLYAGTLNNFARLLATEQKTDSSIATQETVQKIIGQNLTRNFFYQTARQKQSLLDKWASPIQSTFDMAQKHPQRPDAAALAYSGTLFLKNLLLSQHVSLFAPGGQTANNQLRLLTDTLRLVSNQVATQYTLPIAQRKNLDSLEARAETLEKELARQSAPFRQAQQALQVRWQDVRAGLKPKEAAVEFVSFAYHNGRQQTDTVRYLALVLRPGDTTPQVVPLLTDEAPLRRLLTRKKGISGGATLYATRGSEIDTDQLTRGDSLYRLIWQPIERLLINTTTVYFSPSGLLHQVAFAALPYRSSTDKALRYLTDRYQLRQLGSTRQIATQTPDVTYESLRSVRLYGGVQYDSVGVATPGVATPGAWPFLPGTQREVEQIGQVIGKKATVITGAAATETALKTQPEPSSSVLHIATHGFAFPDPAVAATDSGGGGNAFRRVANPLFRTGLLMAGSNRVWQGGRPALGEDDGILTAYEVANLNLSDTKLVVLSACETALGDIRGSEGVFGLQRAFKMAGADYLLMSLWPVSDQATSDLMTRFYRNWKKHKTIRAAFRQTQVQLRQSYPPAVWAAFILVE